MTLDEALQAAYNAASVSDEVLKGIENKSCCRVTVSCIEGSSPLFVFLTMITSPKVHKRLSTTDYNCWTLPAYLDKSAIYFQHLLERGCRLTFGRHGFRDTTTLWDELHAHDKCPKALGSYCFCEDSRPRHWSTCPDPFTIFPLSHIPEPP